MTPDSSIGTLTATTARIDQDLPLVEIGARSGLLWSRQGFTLAGIGTAARLTLDRPGGFATAAAALAAMATDGELDVAGTGPVAFAALPFDPDQPGELIIPELVLGVNDAGQRWLTIIDRSDRSGPADLAGPEISAVVDRALVRVQDLLSEDRSGPEVVEYSLQSSLTPETWRDDVVAAAVARIAGGDLDKAVLARELVLRTDRPIPAELVVARLRAVFPPRRCSWSTGSSAPRRSCWWPGTKTWSGPIRWPGPRPVPPTRPSISVRSADYCLRKKTVGNTRSPSTGCLTRCCPTAPTLTPNRNRRS